MKDINQDSQDHPLLRAKLFEVFAHYAIPAAERVADPANSPVDLSNTLNTELNSITASSAVDAVNKLIAGLSDLSDAVATIQTIADINTIQSNLSTFNQTEGTKSVAIPAFAPQWGTIEDAIVKIQVELAAQATKLPGGDSADELHKIQQLLQDILQKIDTSSLENLTDLEVRVNALEQLLTALGDKIPADLDQELEQIQRTIDSMQSKIDDFARQMQHGDSISFGGTFKNYLTEKIDQGVSAALADQSKVDASGDSTMNWFIASLFSIESFERLITFINAVETGDSSILVPANPKRAAGMRTQVVSILNAQSLLTVYAGYSKTSSIFTMIRPLLDYLAGGEDDDSPPPCPNYTMHWPNIDGTTAAGVLQSAAVEQVGDSWGIVLTVLTTDQKTVPIHFDISTDAPFKASCTIDSTPASSLTAVVFDVPHGQDVVALNSIIAKMIDGTADAYMQDQKQLLSDLVDVVPTVLMAAQLPSIMGDNYYNFSNIPRDYNNLSVAAPVIPPGLTMDLLNSPCPFDTSGKKLTIAQTHFLFMVPDYIKGSPLLWYYFVTNFKLSGFTIREATVSCQHDILNPTYASGEWVLVYPHAVGPYDSNLYAIVEFNRAMLAMSFWRARNIDTSLFPFDVWPFPAQGQSGSSQISDGAMWAVPGGIVTDRQQESSASIVVRKLNQAPAAPQVATKPVTSAKH